MTKTQPLYDFCIVGAGLSGLYLSYLILQKDPTAKVLVLEKESKVGGRIQSKDFCGETVQLGGAVIRQCDKTVLRLVHETLSLQTDVFTDKPRLHYAFPTNTDEMQTILDKLQPQHDKTPLDFLSLHELEKLSVYLGFTDFWSDSCLNFLQNYKIAFSVPGSSYQIVRGGHHRIIESLLGLLDKRIELRTHCTVTKLAHSSKWTVHFDKGNKQTALFQAYARKVVLCTTVSALSQIECEHFPEFASKIQKHIASQPFFRLYTQHSYIPKEFTSVHTYKSFHQVIPISYEKGILMSVYTDNFDALYWHDKDSYHQTVHQCLVGLCKELGIADTKWCFPNKVLFKFWPEGTHYMLPVTLNRHKPNTLQALVDDLQVIDSDSGLFACGEFLSLDMGWSEGAVSSAERLLPKLW